MLGGPSGSEVYEGSWFDRVWDLALQGRRVGIYNLKLRITFNTPVVFSSIYIYIYTVYIYIYIYDM